ncbi:DUF5058 family protein [Amygdalobacter nucleatus]|uniref:DUF5058 domain-containing protein n=1 Tax=Amygdalobacter nucleatus TaxID=3029274 RepID=A0A133YE89_9FIRM|nr:DUF5058 family protein [Amygdalobacter nucleatus]KXB41528.1 hypothetical protein HMPREF1872_00614 [Amygdalobacter nucleatus]MDF0485633.1 DUF5058 family protein [Amygdalobacter nucleatus]WEG36515.1 DUF5058 family protein [Amygdalobacter nucleatus]
MNNQWYYAHHPLMYLVCGLGILLILVQATIILQKSLQCSKEIGMDQAQVKQGMKTAFLNSIGPALGVVGSIWALIVTLGAPVTALRMSVIGGTNYETMAANFGAKAMGGELATSMDPVVFANALWTPALGVMGWLIFTFFFAHRMEAVNKLLTGGRKALLPAVSVGAMLGAFAYFNVDNILKVTVNPAVTVAGALGLVIMVVCQMMGKKIPWLKQWSLTFAMFGGAIIAVLFF